MPEARPPSRVKAALVMLMEIAKHLHACKQQSMLT